MVAVGMVPGGKCPPNVVKFMVCQRVVAAIVNQEPLKYSLNLSK
jgi:hypothetical protein